MVTWLSAPPRCLRGRFAAAACVSQNGGLKGSLDDLAERLFKGKGRIRVELKIIPRALALKIGENNMICSNNFASTIDLISTVSVTDALFFRSFPRFPLLPAF